MCQTKLKTEKRKQQDCTRRNIVYENWCITCEKRSLQEIEDMELEEAEIKEKKQKVKIYKYIGETARSSYERSLEHTRDFFEMKADSHLLKHYLDKHASEEMEEMEFGTKIVKECTSAFNRQIQESVEIQNNMEHHILNSKSEYNRCALPRLTAKLGEIPVEKLERNLEKQKREEKEKERELLSQIRALKLRRSHQRREMPGQTTQPAQKKENLREITTTNEFSNKRHNSRKEKKQKILNLTRRRKLEKPKPQKQFPTHHHPRQSKRENSGRKTLKKDGRNT